MKNLTSPELKKLINSKKVKHVYIFVAFLEDHAKISKTEVAFWTEEYSGRNWECHLTANKNLYIEG